MRTDDVYFKAKVKDKNDIRNGEWVSGYFAKLCDDYGNESNRIYTGHAETDYDGNYYPDWHEVDPATLCQYVWKTDRNKIRIFESDIIQCGNKVLRVVGQSCRFIAQRPNMQPMTWQHVETCGEVVGNVFDNMDRSEMDMKNVDVGKEIMFLHTKFIINDEKPKADFPASGKRHLHFEEIAPFRKAAMNAPRIGRVGAGRKQENELIAIPRGLLMYLIDEAGSGMFIHDLWREGKLKEAGL